MIFLTWLWGKVSGVSMAVWGYAATIGGVLLLLLKVFNSGKSAQKVSDQEQVLKNVEVKNETDTEVESAGATAARDDLLHNYSRD